MIKTDRRFYTVSEAATLLRVNPSTIWRWIAAHKLPAYRVGGKLIRIRAEDLEPLIQRRSEPAPSADQESGRYSSQPISEEELARRRKLLDRLLELREKAVITPLTSADLVHQVREEEREAHDSAG